MRNSNGTVKRAPLKVGLQKGWIAFALCFVAQTNTSCNSQQRFGAQPAEQELGKQAQYNTEVDILFIVDNSNSMAPRQAALASQSASFIQALNTTGLNYRIAVTTTDMDNSGERGIFQGSPKVLQSGVANISGLLASRLQAGVTGSRIEQGRAAVAAALSSTNLSGANAGFLRSKSLLSIIFITDEEDQSPNSDYIKFLNQLKPNLPSGERSWVANYIGVVATDPACTSAEWQYFSPGLKYMELAQASGGTIESVCHADLNQAVQNLHARLLEIITEYFLSGFPIVSSIQVIVDGRSIPQSNTNGYTYNKDRNSITFHGSAIPRPNARIYVTFDPEKLQ